MILSMKQYLYVHIFMGAYFAFFFWSCSRDLGNYDYQEINEVTITGVASTYSVMRGIDTLHIAPTIVHTLADSNDNSRFDYLWVLKAGNRIIDTIGYDANLHYPVDVDPLPHVLQFRVKDKTTDMVWWVNTTLTVGTPFSRGLLLIGEDGAGYAEAEMLSMVRDTLLFKNILSESGLPRLQNPTSFVHTGGNENHAKLWVFTHSGSYYLDRVTLKGTTANSFGSILFTSDPIDPGAQHPVIMAPQIRTAAGAISHSDNRAMITSEGDIFATMLWLNGDYYPNPVNRTADNQGKLLKAAPYLLFSSGNMNGFTWYDTENNRFLYYTRFGIGISSIIPPDGPDDAFPWNQTGTGRQLVYAENTRNTDGGSVNGNSFAIMKDASNTSFVYKFYSFGTTNPIKLDAYTILPMATDFDKADFYAFSSNRTVIFYSVGSRLYAYDYNPGNERIYQFPAIGNDEISMLKFDTQIDHQTNSLYIATYHPESGGTLRRFTVGPNPNIVELIPAPNSEWGGLIKVKDINWRAVN